MKLAPAFLTAITLCIAACGTSNTSPPLSPTSGGNNGTVASGVTNGNTTNSNTINGPATLTVSGTIKNLASDKDAVTLDVNNLQVGVLNPNALDTNGTLNVLSATPIQPSNCTSNAGTRSCKFTISNVDTSAFAGGLLVVTTDSRMPAPAGDVTPWQPLATLVAPAALTAAQATGTLDNVIAYNLSPSGQSAFASLAGAASAGLTTTGAVIGLVSEADNVTPVAGAAVTTSPASGTIFYANSDVTAGSTTGSTSANGLFLGVPASKTVSVFDASATVTPSTGSADMWAVPAAPVVSPLWLVVNLAAQPK